MKALAVLTISVIVLSGAASAGPFDDGDAAYQRGDYAEALAILRPLALQGDAKAQNDLGLMYLNGRGVTESRAEATLWLRLSADQGNADAQARLGHVYFYGWGSVRPDYTESSKWYLAAAEQGYAEGQEIMGSHFESGLGVPQDDVEALKWSILALSAFPASAAESVKHGATVQRDREAEKMSPDELAEAEKRARDWKPTAFRAKTADLYKDALIVLQYDQYADLAARLMRPLAEQGYADAQTMYGAMFMVGNGVAQDDKKAAYWFRLAAQQGAAGAQDSLGMAYEDGQGVPKDPVRALMWRDLATESGDRYASRYAKERDKLASKLTPVQIGNAQIMAQKCKASKFKECD